MSSWLVWSKGLALQPKGIQWTGDIWYQIFAYTKRFEWFIGFWIVLIYWKHGSWFYRLHIKYIFPNIGRLVGAVCEVRQPTHSKRASHTRGAAAGSGAETSLRFKRTPQACGWRCDGSAETLFVRRPENAVDVEGDTIWVCLKIVYPIVPNG